MNRRFWLALIAVALLVWFVRMVVSGVDGPTEGRPAHDEADARREVVKRASAAVVPGAVHLEVGGSPQIFGEESISGELTTCVSIYLRRLDLAGVAMEDDRGGPVQVLLDLAEAQARVLADGGFQPLRGGWSTAGSRVKQPVMDPTLETPGPMLPPPPGTSRRPSVSVRHEYQSDSGGGSGGDWIDLNDPVVTSHRMYLVPDSGATLFVRNSYDNATNTIETEFAYADRTLYGVEYPKGGNIVGREPGHSSYREWIEKKD